MNMMKWNRCNNFSDLITHLSSVDAAPTLFVDATTGTALSSRAFAELSWTIQESLRQSGLRQGDRIALLGQNSTAYLGAMVAIFSAGAVAVPLNLRWAQSELEFAMNDAGVTMLVCDAALKDSGQSLAAAARSRPICLAIEDLVHSTSSRRSGAAADAPRPVDDCIILYSGGTTGRSKGVVHSHLSLLAGARTMAASGYPMPGRIFACCFPLFHVGGLLPTLARLIQQSPAVLIPAFDPSGLCEIVRKLNIQELGLAPTMIRMLMDHKDFRQSDFDTVERLLYGSSPISPNLLADLRRKLPKMELAQAYGMTEAGVFTFLSPARHRESPRFDSAAGQVICADVLLRIEDEKGAECATGDQGEVVVYAESLFSRYLNLPEATAAALRAGGYRTGDIGELDEYGVLTIRDRLNDMIISGGENIYSIEVEAAISKHAAVHQVAVIGLPDDKWGEVPHGVIVLNPGASLCASELSEFLTGVLARYKHPKGLTFLTEMPLTPLGKVAKAELRRTALTVRTDLVEGPSK